MTERRTARRYDLSLPVIIRVPVVRERLVMVLPLLVLGWLGGVVGLVEGCIVVTLVLMGMVAFLPRQDWLISSRLAPVFLTAAHGGSHVVPIDLGQEMHREVVVESLVVVPYDVSGIDP